MPTIDVKKRCIDSKIVYYGPGQSGKTANLKYIHDHLEPDHHGQFVSRATKTNPNLHIDVLPVKFGKILGFQTTFHLCSGPGRALAVSTRKLLLRDTDGIVFVADARRSRFDANLDSLTELEENLEEYGLQISSIPHVIQYNKCDLEDQASIADLRAVLNRHGVPDFEASTVTGVGVLDTLRAAVRSVSEDLQKRI